VREACAEGQAGRAASCSTPSPSRRARGDAAIRATSTAAGRCLSRPPRARLSRRLHALAGAVAQAAGRALGRPRAVGGAAPRLRPRAGDRGLRPQEYWSIDGPSDDAGRAPTSTPGSIGSTARRSTARHRHGAEARRDQGRSRARPSPSPRSRPSRPSNPYPPFTTSTLQQEASRKLGFSPSRTMQRRAALYEGVDIGGETVGLITYMRTDGVDMAPEAIAAARNAIDRRIRRPLPAERPRALHHQGQERAGSARGDPPDRSVAPPKRGAAPSRCRSGALYELIWKRTIASQMESAELERTTVDIDAEGGGKARSCAPPARS
jgi:hypothetical protein